MFRLPLILFSAFILAGCATAPHQQAALVVEVYPFSFEIEQPVKRVQAVFSDGAALEVGDEENAALISKDDPKLLFGNGPEQSGTKNREFLELLLNPKVDSELVNKYRSVLLGDDTTKVKRIEKDEWLFILTTIDVGAVAYGARDDHDWVFQINHLDGYDSLVELIKSAKLILE